MDNNIELITGNEIRHKTYFENNYIVDSLIKGNKVSILTGGSKTGKSTLALQLANSVSKGIPFLNNNTIQCDVLYICLDNDEDLIAERLKLMNLEMDDSVVFCFNKNIVLEDTSSNQDDILLLEVVTETLISHPFLRLVIIDLFDNIRNLTIKTEANNVKDTEDMEYLKGIADGLKIHILLLNHDTKNGSQNGYCSSKGGVKLVGSCNGTYLHLIRSGIGQTSATLEVGGRNVKEEILQLHLDTTTLTYSLSEENINDDKTNQTRFILIGDFETEETGKDKTSLIFSTENKPGALLNVLSVFMENHINLSYIASRPSKHKFGEYIFVVNFDGHIHNPYIMKTIQQVKDRTTNLRFLGSYEKGDAIVLPQ